MSGPPPFGRYEDGRAGGDGLVEVRLLGTPVRVLAAARDHHDDLLREFRLLALAGGDDGAVPHRLAALTRVLGEEHAAASARPDAEVDAALERGADQVDLVYRVPPGVSAAAVQLEALLTEADAYCGEQLLTLARPPVLREFAAWYLACFVEQTAGGPPRPWTGPLDV